MRDRLAGLRRQDRRPCRQRLGAWLTPEGSLLSGGERKRLALARALLARRPGLLLDEPTEGLDAATEQAVVERLEHWLDQTDAGLILVSPRPAAMKLTRRFVKMEGVARYQPTQNANQDPRVDESCDFSLKWCQRELLLLAEIAVFQPPELPARRLDEQEQPAPIEQFLRLLAGFRVADLCICKRHKVAIIGECERTPATQSI